MTHDSIFYCVWYSLGKAVNEIIITTLLEPFVIIYTQKTGSKTTQEGTAKISEQDSLWVK